MTNSNNGTKLSPRAWILIGFLVILFPLSNMLSYQMGELNADMEEVSLRVDLLTCEARVTEVVTKCWGDYARQRHEEGFDLADPARFGEGE